MERSVLRGSREHSKLGGGDVSQESENEVKQTQYRWMCLELAAKNGLKGKQAVDAAKTYYEFMISKMEVG